MATLALTVLGKTIGANWVWMGVLGIAGNYLDQRLSSQTTKVEGGRMQDLKFQASSYGTVIPKVYGSARVAGNIIWSTQFVEHKTVTRSSGGGKGGGGGSTIETTEYSYSISLAIQIAEGPISRIGRVWADGKLYDLTNTTYTLYKGTEEQLPDSFIESIEGIGNVPAYRGVAYIVFQNLYVSKFGNRVPNFTFEIVSQVSNLKNVLEDISISVGLSADDIDATDLAGVNITGYSIESASSGRERISPLQLAYLFDAVESAGQIRFFRRTSNDPLTIPYDDIGAHETEAEEPLRITREDEMELPKAINIKYLSADFDYQEQQMTGMRQITNSKNEVDMTIGLVLQDSYVRELANTKLYEAWVHRNSYETAVTTKYANILPGQVLVLEDSDGSQYSCVVTNTIYGRPGINKISAVAIAGASYQTVEREVDSNIVQQEPLPVTPVSFHFLDIPKLPTDTSLSDIIYYTASADVYQGVNVYKTMDRGTTYDLISQSIRQGIIGATLTKLGDGQAYFFDRRNTVDVKLSSGTLESRPEQDILNGFNIAVIGDEIIQFANAELIAADTYRLSNLLRGRLGTEYLTNNHSIGDRFIIITQDSINGFRSVLEDWYTPRSYRFGSLIKSIDDENYTNVNFTNQARMNMPWSVCHVVGSRDGNGNLAVAWKRRTRFAGEWKDNTDVPLNETSEIYEIDVLSGATVKRTLRVTAPSVVYTAAQQITDFGGVQSSVTLNIYQTSESRGRGIKEEVTV